MSLTVGSSVGVYRVLGRLGAGGMGEVFRARDTALERDVALKALPESFASRADRQGRFQREARLLASLNHPNIGAIHGFETSSSTPVLVLELVEGETLAERLKRGRIPVEEALEIARQVAIALEAAHEQGVVHRDLKPSNIMVTPAAQVKVLDFGLAKALRPELESADAGSAPSQSPTLTQEGGAIVGTAAYMSPEQARGRPVDKRVDLWAFGVVLFEMLTGRHAFAREDTTETLAAVLRDELDWGLLPAETPASVRRLLRRCLERDPRKRLRDAGDARLELEEAIAGPGVATAEEPAAGETAVRGRTLAGVAVAAAVLGAGAAWLALRPSPQPKLPPSRFAVDLPADVRIDDLAVSRDGRFIAFSAGRGGMRQVYLRPLDQVEARPLAGTEGGQRPIFSPDGEWLAYETGSSDAGDAELRRLPRAGGPSVSICRGSFRGGSWRPDGTLLLGSTRGLVAVAAAGGTPRELTTPGEGESHFAPQPVPGTNAVVFQVWTGSTPDARIEVVDLGSGERKRLVPGTGPLLLPSGHLLFGRLDALWGIRFDARRRAVIGEPVRLVERIANSFRGEGVYALSESGNLFYRTPDAAAPRWKPVFVDRAGKETAIPVPEHDVVYPRLSPDGTRIAYGAAGLENEDVWLFDLARSLPIRFTFHPAQELDVAWAAGGQKLLFHSHRDGPGNIYRQAANGTGPVERLTRVAAEQIPSGVSADGRFLLLTVETKDQSFDVQLLPLDHGGEAAPLLSTPASEAAAVFSGDGRFVAYVSDESGRSEIYVRPFPDVESDRFQVSSGGGQSPLFSRNGRELFFSTGGSLKRVAITTTPVFQAGPVETVLSGPYVEGRGDERQYDVSPDGRRFLMLKEGSPTDSRSGSVRLRAVLGWEQELRRLMTDGD